MHVPVHGIPVLRLFRLRRAIVFWKWKDRIQPIRELHLEVWKWSDDVMQRGSRHVIIGWLFSFGELRTGWHYLTLATDPRGQ